MCDGEIEEIVKQYFDLNRDYEKIKETLSKIDQNMKTSVEYGKGIRILNQDLWETIISFIIYTLFLSFYANLYIKKVPRYVHI